MAPDVPTVRPAQSPPLTQAAPGSMHVPGPVDRVHFLDEQRRYRRASRRFTALAALAVLITGIPACIVITPLVFTLLMTIGHIVNAISPISPETLQALREWGQSLSDAADTLEASLDASAMPARAALLRIAFLIAVLVLPGALALFALWIGIRRVLGHVAVGHVLEAAGTRQPNERDLEERQLTNVVEEMAIAAGVKPPRVLIVETDAVNAAAMGTEIDDATVLVTRGLLDKLDRDETQAVIGHVIGSVGNGDLKIASIIFSIYQTWGALTLLMNAPFGRTARRAVWRGIRTAFRGRTRAVDRWEAEFVSETFLRGAVDFEDPDVSRRMAQTRRGLAGKWDAFVNVLSLPLTLGSYVVQFAVFFSSVALIGPIVSFMWRTRRHLADAMAVQLTRNPDALARALAHLAREKTVVAKGDEMSLLFVVWPATVASKNAVVGQFARMHPKPHQRQRRLIALGAEPTVIHKPPGIWAGVRDALSPGKWNKMTPVAVIMMFLFFIVVPALMATALVLSAILVVMLTMLSLMLMMVQMVVAWAVLKFLFLTLPGWIRR
ncbi:MAG TPA: M48 family metalloprotease [Gemmatimonadaceae bacterium]|nr:M48 family metalloprotease [Gemmatimonadaceae bacterium]